MIVHSQFFRKSRESCPNITKDEAETVLYVLETAYSKARYELSEDFLSWESFVRVVEQLEMKSSPGYPYCRESSSIGEWLGYDAMQFDQTKLERLWYDMWAFIDGTLESLYRVFVKREPHSKIKAASNRWRLIVCPPLYEQVAWALVFGPGNDREIDTTGYTPSMQGMYLVGGNWKWHLRLFETKGLDTAMDKSAWDWTAHIELIELELRLRERLITSGPVEEWRRLATEFYRRAFYHPRLMLSNGQVYEQLEPGIVKSGCINTISMNSHCQVIAHVLLCLRGGRPVHPLPVAVGDDTLVRGVSSPTIEEYATLGIVVKELVSAMEFVGHVFDEDGPVPKYGPKHVFRYTEVAEEHLPSFLDSMVRLYAHSDEWQNFWRLLARRHEVAVPSPSYVRYWYDYPTEYLSRSGLMLMLGDC